MIGIILLITLLIGLLALVVVLIYSRQSEVELTDRSVDLGDVLPIQTITKMRLSTATGTLRSGIGCFCRRSSPFRRVMRSTSTNGWKPC